MELFYCQTVDGIEFETLSIHMTDQTTLKALKAILAEENEWGSEATVLFYREANENSRPLALATPLETVLQNNSAERPLCVIVTSSTQQVSSHFGAVIRIEISTVLFQFSNINT